MRKPSLLTIAWNLLKGIRIQFNTKDSRAWNHPTPIPVDSALVFPVSIEAFGSAALEASVVVVKSRTPTHPCAGIVSIVGVHPGDPEVNVHLQLQALGRVSVAEQVRILDVVRKSP